MNASDLPVSDMCPVCLAIQPYGEGAATIAIEDDAATILLTVRDETGRRAIIRTDIPLVAWNAPDPAIAGMLIVKELKFALDRLRKTTDKQRDKDARRADADPA